eukprot:Sspe_Gene.82179::Locus_53860_Transcript_1_1_Confidence_1.000_Length_1904::g.82179::m.82179
MVLRRARCCLSAAPKAMPELKLEEWLGKVDNTFIKTLEPDTRAIPQAQPRQVDSHYVHVTPVPAPSPKLVAVSPQVAAQLQLDPKETERTEFLDIVTGRTVPPNTSPWASAYGCHHGGMFMGQMGDGRAMSLFEILTDSGTRFELQLKGAGRTPFGRGFDGKCVLRSCIREFLATESLAALGVPTTRVLSVALTGETVRRPWFPHTTDIMKKAQGGRPTFQGGGQVVKAEPGAVTCRVAPSYLRLGQMELFWKRGDMARLEALADYAIRREFADIDTTQSKVMQYRELVSRVVKGNADMVAAWQGVGYVHGNMNTDNLTLGGRTLDFGPFGMMEDFEPRWTPWVARHYAYCFQHSIMWGSLRTWGRGMQDLTRHVGGTEEDCIALDTAVAKFETLYQEALDSIRQRKLGLARWDKEAAKLWEELLRLMAGSETDYTITFRQLCELGDTLDALRPAFPEDSWPPDAEWEDWFRKYKERVAGEGRSEAVRQAEMKAANPAMILRNWVAAMVYEKAENGDMEMLHKVHRAVTDPYRDPVGDASEWYQRRPDWASAMPGVYQMT